MAGLSRPPSVSLRAWTNFFICFFPLPAPWASLVKADFWAGVISFFLAPVAAGFIAEAVRWGVGRRRSRYLGRVAAVSLILATLLMAGPVVVVAFLGGGFWGVISPAIFAFLGASTLMARLR